MDSGYKDYSYILEALEKGNQAELLEISQFGS